MIPELSGIGRSAAFSVVLLGGLTACSGPALTPLQVQYQRGEERALRYHARGELPLARQAFQDNLRQAEMVDDRPMIVTQALNIGMVALALGELPLAEQNFAQAQRVALGINDQSGQLRAQLGLAQVALRREQWTVAQSEFQQALTRAREWRDTAALLVALNGLGLVHKAQGEPAAARELWREAEMRARATGEKRLLAATLANQAALDLQIGEVRQATVRIEEAIALDRELENLSGLAQDLGLLAHIHQQENRILDALDLYRQARTIAQHTGQRAWVELYHQEIDRLQRKSSAPL
ncbi:MAG: tetratricopeptide repeat protein [Candidatus Competibacteraceae bacterium]